MRSSWGPRSVLELMEVLCGNGARGGPLRSSWRPCAVLELHGGLVNPIRELLRSWWRSCAVLELWWPCEALRGGAGGALCEAREGLVKLCSSWRPCEGLQGQTRIRRSWLDSTESIKFDKCYYMFTMFYYLLLLVNTFFTTCLL